MPNSKLKKLQEPDVSDEDDIIDLDPLDSPEIADYDNPFDASKPPLNRQFTAEDARSLVGGDSVSLEIDGTSGTSDSIDANAVLGKVFLFSLPFGGFSGLVSGLKFPSFPFINKYENEEVEQELARIKYRLSRQLSVTTIEEARHFSNVKGLPNDHTRAIKTSLIENISDLVPDFIMKNKAPHDLIYDELDGPILVMGGYRGSVLRETGTGKRVWAPIKAGLNLSNVNLLLGPEREDEIKATDNIYPDGMLKNVGPFDICKRFVKRLHNGKTTVRDFGYDWRQSLDLSRDKLIIALEELYEETGRRTIVIAHSMGGLVAHGAMQLRPDLFRGLIYVGVPSECLNIIGPIRYGDSVMFSDRILTFETNFMMRSSFAFLPLSGRVFRNKETGEQYDLDFFDPATWVEYNLNPLVAEFRKKNEEDIITEEEKSQEPEKCLTRSFSPTPLSYSGSSSSFSKISIGSAIKKIPSKVIPKSKPTAVTNEMMIKRHNSKKSASISDKLMKHWADYKFSLSFSEAYDYLSQTLKRTKEYVLGLNYKEELSSKYPPLAVVYGNKIPSVRGSYVSSREDIKDGKYYEFFYGAGDGVIHHRWLMPQDKGFDFYDSRTGSGHIVGKFSTSRGHVDLMTDLETMADALSAIVEADKVWKR